MGRTLAHGRLSKEDPGETFRQNGLIAAQGNNGVFGNHLDQLLFEAHGYEHILGSAVQVGSDFATMTWDQNDQRFEDKSGAEVVLSHYERIAVIGMDTLTDNIVLDNLTGLELFHIGNTPGQTGDNPKFQLGDAGGGEPFKIKLGPNTKDCKLDLLTDKPFEELVGTLMPDQKRYIANQGRNNHIRVNGQNIYNPSHTGEIVQFDALPHNPYLLRMDGDLYHWTADTNNVDLAWFRNLNIFLDGTRWDGAAFQETNSRFTTPANITTTEWLFQVNMSNRFLTDLMSDPPDGDTRIHERTDPTGVSISLQGNFINSSNIVTFTGTLGNVKNNMRINGASARGIPDGAAGTTILRNVNSTAWTAEMHDALTGAAVNATLTGPTTVDMDNSGAVGGSHDEDAFQNITGSISSSALTSPYGPFHLDETGVFSLTTGAIRAGVSQSVPSQLRDVINFDAADSPLARTHDQTQPKSTAVRFYYRA